MDYLQRLVFQAMSKNPEHDESYAHEFALEQIRESIDLTQLDFSNRDLLAAEISATPEEMDAFIMIT